MKNIDCNPDAKIYSTVSMAIEAAEEKHGSLRAVAKVIGVDVGYLSRLKSGDATNPGDRVLTALGLEKVVTYRTLISASAPNPVSGEQKPASVQITGHLDEVDAPPEEQDVSGLVEALEQISSYSGDVAYIADEALAVYRSQAQER